MTRHMVIPLAAAIGICAAHPAARAHHSYPTFYDLCTSVTIEGRVDRVQWEAPHVWIDLQTDDGTAYGVEWTGPRNLAAAGVATDALKAGDRVVVTGSPVRDPALMREHYPALSPDQALNVISALTRIRRASDEWSWQRAEGPPPSRMRSPAGC